MSYSLQWIARAQTMSMIREAFKRLGRSAYVQKLRHVRRQAFSERYLLFTNVTISLTLSSVGDILEQQYERYAGYLDKWDRKRTVNMAISGVTVGVICHHWYKFLDQRMPGRTIKIVLQKVVLDQLICSPFYISMFFVTLGILENQSKDEIIAEIKNKAWRLYAAEWTVWPPAQIINFYFLPNRYRVFYDNLISLGYDVFTSKVKYQKPWCRTKYKRSEAVWR